MSDYAFAVELARSHRRADYDIWAIQQLLPHCESARQSTKEDDLAGIDYLAKLRNGRDVPVDAKYRKRGASKYWKYSEPELALERYSVVPDSTKGHGEGKIGWTLDPAKLTEYVLFTFHPDDTPRAFLMPFQSLRAAFLANGEQWLDRYGKKGSYFYESSNNGQWESAALFVPASVVIDAMGREMWIGGEAIPCAGCGTDTASIPDDTGRYWCVRCHD